jgi:hypothetical protein
MVIWIGSPCFAADDSIVDVLGLGGLSGADAAVSSSHYHDHPPVYPAAFTCFAKACRTGVRLFRYTD